MIYFFSNLFAAFLIIIFFIFSNFISLNFFKKVNILIITFVSLLISLSVLLTNIIGYNIFIFRNSIKLSLGNYIIFIIGMLFGPFFGILSGIITDLLGVLINVNGIFHLGFTFNLVFYGFFGSLVFWKTNKFWFSKSIIFYILVFFIISFFLNFLWLYSIGFNKIFSFSFLLIKLLKFPIELFFYLPLMTLTFYFCYNWLIKRNLYFWCIRYGEIKFNFSKKNNK